LLGDKSQGNMNPIRGGGRPGMMAESKNRAPVIRSVREASYRRKFRDVIPGRLLPIQDALGQPKGPDRGGERLRDQQIMKWVAVVTVRPASTFREGLRPCVALPRPFCTTGRWLGPEIFHSSNARDESVEVGERKAAIGSLWARPGDAKGHSLTEPTEKSRGRDASTQINVPCAATTGPIRTAAGGRRSFTPKYCNRWVHQIRAKAPVVGSNRAPTPASDCLPCVRTARRHLCRATRPCLEGD